MSDLCCKKCGSIDVYTEKKGTQTGLYCRDCGAWIKWLGKEEKRVIEKKDDGIKQRLHQLVHTLECMTQNEDRLQKESNLNAMIARGRSMASKECIEELNKILKDFE